MRKIIFAVLLAMVFIPAIAQVGDFSFVIRHDNTYIVGSVTMNKKAFMGFLQSRDAVNYNYFRSAYRLSNAGWGLFGGGLAVGIVGAFFGGYIVSSVGGIANTAGIVCLAVGYARMHNTVNNYNALNANRLRKSAVDVALQSSQDGIGLAIRF